MSELPLVRLDNVSCTYYVRRTRLRMRSVDVLKDINLSLYKGEILGVVGRNGAGKSTLLRILGQIIIPDSGQVHVDKELTVSLLTLSLGFSPDLSGRENAILGALYMGYTRKEAEARLEQILAFAELGEWVDEPIRTYSTGMQARLAFSVALEMSPDILLVDEILGVGDAYFQEKSSAALQKKIGGGQTTVLVTHDPNAMKRLCTRLVWLENGQVHMVGEPEFVMEKYHDAIMKHSNP